MALLLSTLPLFNGRSTSQNVFVKSFTGILSARTSILRYVRRVTKLLRYCIEAWIVGGDFDRQLQTVPRTKLTSGEDEMSFILCRKQFPVRLCFAMTINKSQGSLLRPI
jgi:hypothetical protein